MRERDGLRGRRIGLSESALWRRSCVFGFAWLLEGGAGNRSRAKCALMLVECALGLSVVGLPVLSFGKQRPEMRAVLYVRYIVFRYGAIFSAAFLWNGSAAWPSRS